MNDELRKAAQDVLDEWDGPSRVGSWSPLMKSLRAALANNSNAASQEKGIRDILRDTVRSIIAAHSDGDLDVPLAIEDLRVALAKNANAAPDSSLAPIIESLIGKYWDIAYEEGKTGISQGDLANQVLGRIRNALIAWAQRAAPQDQNSVSVPLDFLGAVCGALNRSGESPKLLEKARNFVQHGMGHHTNAAPEQEPVATDCTRIMREQGKPYPRTCPRCGFGPCVYSSTIVIAAPAPTPQREWQGLTKDEINDCAGAEIYPSTWAMAFARAIEAVLKEKNHG